MLNGLRLRSYKKWRKTLVYHRKKRPKRWIAGMFGAIDQPRSFPHDFRGEWILWWSLATHTSLQKRHHYARIYSSLSIKKVSAVQIIIINGGDCWRCLARQTIQSGRSKAFRRNQIFCKHVCLVPVLQDTNYTTQRNFFILCENDAPYHASSSSQTFSRKKCPCFDRRHGKPPNTVIQTSVCLAIGYGALWNAQKLNRKLPAVFHLQYNQ